MKEYVLSYYPKFNCIAEKCKHTCCAGWVINIDNESLIKYKAENSDYKEKLKKGIKFSKSRFKTDKKERCYFLNDNGLCDLIINLGKDRLCQVCKDHPRFRSFFTNFTETGLGFCCEEATKIILTYQDKITPVLDIDDKNTEKTDFIEESVISFREKALSILQDRTLLINDRIYSLLELVKFNLKIQDFNKIAKAFSSLESVDKTWDNKIKSLKNITPKYVIDQSLAHYSEQFLANSIYRHLSLADDVRDAHTRLIFTIVSWWIIFNIYDKENQKEQNLELLIDIIRQYSVEVEYSQKNLGKIIKFINKIKT